jgi:hypothetical protein
MRMGRVERIEAVTDGKAKATAGEIAKVEGVQWTPYTV